MCHDPLVLNKFFLEQTNSITFIYLWVLFIVQNFLKNSYSRSRVMRMHYFEKIMNITFIYLLAPFIVKNFQKIVTADPELQGCITFWAISDTFATIKVSLRKRVNNPSSFHSFPSRCQISK